MITKLHNWLPCLSWWKNKAIPKLNKRILIPGAACAVFVLSATPVYAYIDPGTGSMIVQAIAAGVLTAGAMVGVFWRTIKNFFLSLGKHRTTGAADKASGANPVK